MQAQGGRRGQLRSMEGVIRTPILMTSIHLKGGKPRFTRANQRSAVTPRHRSRPRRSFGLDVLTRQVRGLCLGEFSPRAENSPPGSRGAGVVNPRLRSNPRVARRKLSSLRLKRLVHCAGRSQHALFVKPWLLFERYWGLPPCSLKSHYVGGLGPFGAALNGEFHLLALF